MKSSEGRMQACIFHLILPHASNLLAHFFQRILNLLRILCSSVLRNLVKLFCPSYGSEDAELLLSLLQENYSEILP